MGIDFTAMLFYGMPIQEDLGWDLIDTFNDLDSPLEVANLDSYSAEGTYMLIVSESFESGDKHEEVVLVKLSDVMGKESEWRQLIYDACKEHSIAFVEPDWYFATSFS